jgi:hypothetical protein
MAMSKADANWKKWRIEEKISDCLRDMNAILPGAVDDLFF